MEVFKRHFNEVVYLPDTLSSGRRIVAEVDYTHMGSRARLEQRLLDLKMGEMELLYYLFSSVLTLS